MKIWSGKTLGAGILTASLLLAPGVVQAGTASADAYSSLSMPVGSAGAAGFLGEGGFAGQEPGHVGGGSRKSSTKARLWSGTRIYSPSGRPIDVCGKALGIAGKPVDAASCAKGGPGTGGKGHKGHQGHGANAGQRHPAKGHPSKGHPSKGHPSKGHPGKNNAGKGHAAKGHASKGNGGKGIRDNDYWNGHGNGSGQGDDHGNGNGVSQGDGGNTGGNGGNDGNTGHNGGNADKPGAGSSDGYGNGGGRDTEPPKNNAQADPSKELTRQ